MATQVTQLTRGSCAGAASLSTDRGQWQADKRRASSALQRADAELRRAGGRPGAAERDRQGGDARRRAATRGDALLVRRRAATTLSS